MRLPRFVHAALGFDCGPKARTLESPILVLCVPRPGGHHAFLVQDEAPTVQVCERCRCDFPITWTNVECPFCRTSREAGL